MKRTRMTVGEKIGRLTAAGRIPGTSPRDGMWVFACECGRMHRARSYNVRAGRTSSCGCLQRETAGMHTITHGLSGSAEYRAWRAMHNRCKAPSGATKARYVDRGITVCERWSRFANFFADMGPRPSDRHSVDRINNDGNYEPGNCRWATRKEQASNTSANKRVEFNGLSVTIGQLAGDYGLDYNTLKYRIKAGWLIADALSVAPSLKNRRRRAKAI